MDVPLSNDAGQWPESACTGCQKQRNHNGWFRSAARWGWPGQLLWCLRMASTTNPDAAAPIKNGAPIPRTAHAEYSDGSAPSQTGDQYKQNEATKGRIAATSQADRPGRVQHQSPLRSAEAPATMAMLEPSYSDCNIALMANAGTERCGRSGASESATDASHPHSLQ